MTGLLGGSSPAIHKAAGRGQPVTQDISLSVRGDKVVCSINGSTVASYDKTTLVGSGKLKSTNDPEPIMRMFEGPVNFGTNRLLRGIVIRSNPGPETEKAAKALVRMLVDSGFDVTEGPTVPPGTSPIQALGVDAERASAGDFGKRAIVFVSVEPRPDGPQGDAKLRAMHEARNKKTNAKTP